MKVGAVAENARDASRTRQRLFGRPAETVHKNRCDRHGKEEDPRPSPTIGEEANEKEHHERYN